MKDDRQESGDRQEVWCIISAQVALCAALPRPHQPTRGLSRHQACFVIFSIVPLAVADLRDDLKSWLDNASGQRMAA